jgi:hypothetical protein
VRALALFVLAAAALVLHEPATAETTERDRLAAERQSLNDSSAAQEQACRQRFLVNDCVAEVRARRREALRPLRERELQIDDAERRQRAQERESSREARRIRPVPLPRAASQPAAAASALPSALSAASAAPSAASGARPGLPARNGGEVQSRAAEAAGHVRAAELRAQEASAAQARVARRIAQRNASGKKSTPLPTSAASEAAR